MALNIFEVVRYEGEDTRNILAWRHPNKNMKPGTTLIVNPGQRAVFSQMVELLKVMRKVNIRLMEIILSF